jgi:hypothetical protein
MGTCGDHDPGFGCSRRAWGVPAVRTGCERCARSAHSSAHRGCRPPGARTVADRLVTEARDLFGLTRALLLSVEGAEATVVAASPPGEARPEPSPSSASRYSITRSPAPASRWRPRATPPRRWTWHSDRRPRPGGARRPLRSRGEVTHVLVLADAEGAHSTPMTSRWRSALATPPPPASRRCGWQRTHRADRPPGALARAAKTLNESLDLNRVLVRSATRRSISTATTRGLRGDGARA